MKISIYVLCIGFWFVWGDCLGLSAHAGLIPTFPAEAQTGEAVGAPSRGRVDILDAP